MKSYLSFCCLILVFCACSPEEKLSPMDQQVQELLAQMTVEEKLGQLSQRHVNNATAESELRVEDVLEDIRAGRVGSVLNQFNHFFTLEERNLMQKVAVEESRLGIPIIFAHDVIHGYETAFPINLAQSCTWSEEMVEKAAQLAGKEAAMAGVDWTFAPMVDISRDPRWGRISECFGEDPFLNGRFGAATVRGFQGQDLADPYTIAACMKHFVGYGAGLGGRDYQEVEISDRTLNEIYLPPFKACLDAGVVTAMSGFQDINGHPATGNQRLFRNLLKEQWAFDGFVVSDWEAVAQLATHGYAKDSTVAAEKALTAGIDMEMKTLCYRDLGEAFKRGALSEELLDEAVGRILKVKLQLGLFDQPFVEEQPENKKSVHQEAQVVARQMAAASMVLLQNKQGILPLQQDQLRQIAVVGPFAKEQNLMGWWKSVADPEAVTSPLEGMRRNAPQGVIISDRLTATTDVIILCVGEEWTTFGEAHSRSDIKLPGQQEELIRQMSQYGKPVITVVFNGRPLDLSGVLPHTDGLLLAWHPGTTAGDALSDVLWGKYNPAGKLTTSFPKSVGQLPVYYNHKNSGRPTQNNYIDEDADPLFPFGFGLSYTSFDYANLKIDQTTLSEGETINISVEVHNTGAYDGHEVVQLYSRNMVGSTTRPVKELKDFKRIFLKAGEKRLVKFSLSAEDIKVLNERFEAVLEAGLLKVWLGPNSAEGLEATVRIQ
ncbi:glycoside hydrolase family 3 N-terminal domain-containing protein [Persicobacter diffluens]|uniref:beta-glucosidase n=1 Tax=Persicobacter diffluens TaxID=981 RepID=A0AAN4W511_9BACT|nr:beta-glucosidase [Persicobacter diffluens]